MKLVSLRNKLRSIRLVWVTVVALQIMLNDKYKLNHCKEMGPVHLGKVSPTFPAALFTVDARFARKIERLQTGIK